ncbi:TetR/AcrR family transcriptional regulator [Streptomyces noursei]|uniref:TetR/AcrR family transcriptional regulator n=1 Tax=Streptomyces noursei TaxID=1971 RepID=UPI0023B814BA|nr:TetR/AcrR family transcriptional regulator [Streptomyces noursei]
MPAEPDPARRSHESWRAILDATFELLEEGGYESVTMGAIAARAGVGRQTLYRWWPSKAAVVFEVFLDKTNIGSFLDGGEDFPAQLRAFAHGFRALYVEGPAGTRLRELIGAAQTDPDLARAMVGQWFEPRRAPVRQALHEAQKAGVIRTDVAADAALDLVFAPLHYRLLVSGQPVDAEYVNAIVDLALAALAPGAPSA